MIVFLKIYINIIIHDLILDQFFFSASYDFYIMSNNSTNQGTVGTEPSGATTAPIHEVTEVAATGPTTPLGS